MWSFVSFPSFFFLSQDPFLRGLQLGLIFLGAADVFCILFATRDILLRTRSFIYQLLCILLVAGLPFIGFLLYLLIRPARTTKEREVEALLREVIGTVLPTPDQAPLPLGFAAKSDTPIAAEEDTRLGLPSTESTPLESMGDSPVL